MSAYLMIVLVFTGVMAKLVESNKLPEMLPTPEQFVSAIDGPCTSDDDCSSVHGTTCLNATSCQCTNAFKKEKDRCVFGAPCTASFDCLQNAENSKCHGPTESTKTCKCSDGYMLKGNSCKLNIFPGDNCKDLEPKHCENGGVCIDKFCNCSSPFYISTSEDKKICLFGSNCTNDNDCRGMGIKDAICLTDKKICSCPNGHERLNTLCIKTDTTTNTPSSTNRNFAALTTILFIVLSTIL